MTYITARIRATKVYHGYDAERRPIIDVLPQSEFIEKIIKLDRILSFTEDYIFLECPHNTIQTWEYEGGLSDIREQLRAIAQVA